MSGGRLRKAWRLTTVDDKPWSQGQIIYAPTRSKARAQQLSGALECGWDARSFFRHIRVRRAPECDVRLPSRHPVADTLTPDQLDTVLHAYGGTGRKAGYRDHFCTHPGDLDLLRLAWVEGLFKGPFSSSAFGERYADGTPEQAFFYLTDRGKAVALSCQPEYPTHA
ncbi:hypothetical protein [Roseomonas populi]|uniref:RES domain-containing protein n=1 Tax=Roseomonas populi TaxID=3121582 RepID=A0ABT1X145_9PROT|nr:hypothetical protein [Roseomonas pecuniae]MCR0981817.1 hypothetical protein [Roseomonas pecuniae]